MPVFVVAGYPDCYLFNHARYVANYLSTHLPNFKLHVIEVPVNKWKTWLKKKNLENGWYHFESPLIYKEFRMRGGKPHYIGGLSEFWEYCYDYYGLVSSLNQEDLTQLCADTMQFFERMDELKSEEYRVNPINICISGDHEYLIHLLIMEILSMDNIFSGKNQIIISIHNQNNVYEDNIEEDEMNEWPSKLGFVIKKLDDLSAGIKECDLFILTGNFTREIDEEFYKWLNRNYLSMENLALEITDNCKRSLRIIVAVHGPVCFDAAVLMARIPDIDEENIVALTADVGLEVLSVVKDVTNAIVRDLGAPPIWGFIGVNQIIDLEHILEVHNIYRPNLRAVIELTDSTLPLGNAHKVIRFFSYLAGDLKDSWIKISERKKNEAVDCPQNNYSKVRSIISLIYNWFSMEKHGNIISLGIISDGSFGIPKGMVFSQPVQLKNKRWQPAKMFPTPRRDPAIISDLFEFVNEIYAHFGLNEAVSISKTDSNFFK